MQFLSISLRRWQRCYDPRRHLSRHRTLVDFVAAKHIRDRGLDHAVEREKHLKQMMDLKNLIKSEPSKSLPLSIITQQKDTLKIPMRPIEFIRKYPSVFEEYLPGGIGIQPHIKLTPQVLELDAEEQLIYQSEIYRKDIADRVLKLLMINRIDTLPLKMIDLIKWDLGLPDDYLKGIVPEFPDCFRVVGGKDFVSGFSSDSGLELVCWSDELAVSVMEKKAKKGEKGYEKGIPIAFPMQFSKGFEVDKQLKKWFDEWQKLPYISPYENAAHLGPSTDESDKWTAGVLHEVLNLFVSKKVDRDTLLCLGESLGIRSRFKRALLHHPGIFYLSGKMGTYTVVLRDAYKRGLIIEKNPMTNIRNQYVHLMHTVIEDRKVISVPGGIKQQEKNSAGSSKGGGKEDGQEAMDGADSNEDNDDYYSDDDDEEEEEEEEKGGSKKHGHRSAGTSRKFDKKMHSDRRGPSRNAGREMSIEKLHGKTKGRFIPKDSSRRDKHNPHKRERSATQNSWGKSLADRRNAIL